MFEVCVVSSASRVGDNDNLIAKDPLELVPSRLS